MRMSRRLIVTSALAGTLANVLLCGTAFAAFTATIPVTGTGPVDLRTLANSNGYTGGDATITYEVGNGVVIMGAAGEPYVNPDGGPGIDSGTWPGGSAINLTLVVKTGGAVLGGGGAGGNGGTTYFDWGRTSGGIGGDAVYARVSMSVTVQSGAVLAGGGQGGASGGGADYWDGSQDWCWGGSGGGGGYPNGYGGLAGGNDVQSPYTWCYEGDPGEPGTTSSAGLGGLGPADSRVPWWYGYGGTGGNPGQFGYGVRKNGNTVPVSNSGTIYGAVN